jgi:NAD-dependent DNA ligase
MPPKQKASKTSPTPASKPKKATASSKKKLLEHHLEMINKGNIDDLLIEITTEQLVTLLQHAANNYYNGSSIMTDDNYDILMEHLATVDPNNEFLNHIGFEVETKNKVTLPFFMGSMNKVKIDTIQVMHNWSKSYTGPYVISDKLDGVSAMLFFTTKDSKPQMFTRGNGQQGQDITYLIPHIQNLSELSVTDLTDPIAIRGELIISKSDFEKHSDEFENARNLVSGIVNAKKVTTKLTSSVQFVAYEIMNPLMKPSKQLKMLTKMGFKTVTNVKVTELAESFVVDYLRERKSKSEFEIDGIIITDDNEHERPTNENPKYAFAFKENDTFATVKVVNVEYDISKDGYIKPVVHIEPTRLDGVVISKATAHNGRYIMDNGIGVNAIIKIVRSGGVIPKIVDVVKRVDPLLPSVKWKWNKSNAEFVVDDDDNEEAEARILIKNLTYFFVTLDVVGLNEATIINLVNAGFNSIQKIIQASIDDLMTADGIQKRKATSIYNNIRKSITNVPLAKLMTASNLFGHGIGEKRLTKVLEHIPNLLTIKLSKEELKEKIIEIDGFEEITASFIVDNLSKFVKFLQKVPEITFIIPEKNEVTGSLFDKMYIVFTGFRNETWENAITSNGGHVQSGVNGKTTMLVVKDEKETSTKTEKAKSLGVEIVSMQTFKNRFKLA